MECVIYQDLIVCLQVKHVIFCAWDVSQVELNKTMVNENVNVYIVFK